MPLANLLVLIVCVLIYFFFRAQIYTYCRMLKIRKRDIRKKMKGFSNYWLYSQLNKEYSISIYYYLNLIYLICLSVIILLIPLSFIPLLETPTIVVGLIICLITIPVFCISLSNANLDSFGRKFVVFRVFKTTNGKGRHFASMFDWLIGFLPLAIYIIFLIIH